MHGISRNPTMFGRCGGCGEAHRITAGAIGDVVDHGEQFESDYCCKNCLDEHGPTEHVRVHLSEVDS